MAIKRMGKKNPIQAKNFIAPLAEQRRAELEKARQQFQSNSFSVDSPVVVYYQQVRNGLVCTCHAQQAPLEPEQTQIIESALINHSDKVTEVSFSTISKTPMFGSLANRDELDDEEELLLNDEENGGSLSPMFSNLFHKGVDCGICFRTGYTPLFAPIGRQFYSLTSNNYSELDGYSIDGLKFPNAFQALVADCFVTFMVKVPKYYKEMRYAIYNNTEQLINNLYIMGANGSIPLTKVLLDTYRGKDITVYVKDTTFTHVFMEFDLGIEVRANFPQFSLAKDYSYFMNLQQVTIELPPSISNAQVNDLIYIPTWERLFCIFDIQPKLEGPNQTVMLGTSVQGRLVQTVETFRILTKMKVIK